MENEKNQTVEEKQPSSFSLFNFSRRLLVLLVGLVMVLGGFCMSGIINIHEEGVQRIVGHFISIIGTVIIVEVIAHSVHSTYIFNEFKKNVDEAKKDILKEMSNVVKEQISNVFNENFEDLNNTKCSGILAAGRDLHDMGYLKKIKDATKFIWILRTYLHDDHLVADIIENVSPEAKVQILLTHPNSIYAMIRSHELGEHLNFVSEKVMSNLDRLSKINRDNVEVRLYVGSAALNVYAADDIIYLGFFWRKRSSTTSPALKIKFPEGDVNSKIDFEKNHFAYYSVKHYNAVLEHSKRVDFNDPDWRKILRPDPKEARDDAEKKKLQDEREKLDLELKIMTKYVSEYPQITISEEDNEEAKKNYSLL